MKLTKERLEDVSSHLIYAFQRIHNPGFGSQKPYITRKQIIKAYEAFLRNKGRSEWEHEAVKKSLIGDECPVDHYSSGQIQRARLCEKCRPFFPDVTEVTPETAKMTTEETFAAHWQSHITLNLKTESKEA